MTYTELLQAIRDYTEVDSNVLTDSICNGFIRDAEWRIARDVDADYDRQYSTATLIPGQRYLNMPQPYLIIRSIQIINTGGSTLAGLALGNPCPSACVGFGSNCGCLDSYSEICTLDPFHSITISLYGNA